MRGQPSGAPRPVQSGRKGLLGTRFSQPSLNSLDEARVAIRDARGDQARIIRVRPEKRREYLALQAVAALPRCGLTGEQKNTSDTFER